LPWQAYCTHRQTPVRFPQEKEACHFPESNKKFKLFVHDRPSVDRFVSYLGVCLQYFPVSVLAACNSLLLLRPKGRLKRKRDQRRRDD